MMENFTETSSFDSNQWNADLSTVSDILNTINSTTDMEEAETKCLQKYPSNQVCFGEIITA